MSARSGGGRRRGRPPESGRAILVRPTARGRQSIRVALQTFAELEAEFRARIGDRNVDQRRAWEEFVLPHVDAFDRDHYETVWAAVVRTGPKAKPFG